MANQNTQHAATTDCAHIALNRVRTNWLEAWEAGQTPEPWFYQGEAKGILDLWADLTGVASSHPDYQALNARVREVTKR